MVDVGHTLTVSLPRHALQVFSGAAEIYLGFGATFGIFMMIPVTRAGSSTYTRSHPPAMHTQPLWCSQPFGVHAHTYSHTHVRTGHM